MVSLSILREYNCKGGLYSSPKEEDSAELASGAWLLVGIVEGPVDEAAGGAWEEPVEGPVNGAAVGALGGPVEGPVKGAAGGAWGGPVEGPVNGAGGGA